MIQQFELTGRGVSPKVHEALQYFFEHDVSRAQVIRKFKVNRGNFNDWIARIIEFDAVEELFDNEEE